MEKDGEGGAGRKRARDEDGNGETKLPLHKKQEPVRWDVLGLRTLLLVRLFIGMIL